MPIMAARCQPECQRIAGDESRAARALRFASGLHLEGWDVLYIIIVCYIANILPSNRNLFGYIAFN